MRNEQPRTCVITGANSGIGKAMALNLAQRGMHLVLVCRDQARGHTAQHEIQMRSGNPDVDLLIADLSSQTAIRTLAADLLARCSQIHVLINNAGLQRMDRCLTVDGLEMTWAVNHLAPFLLTNLLRERFKASPPARIITTSSVVHRWATMDWDNLQGERHYDSNQAYNRSKLANLLFTHALARRLDPALVTVNAFEPGLTRTDFTRDYRGFYRVMARIMGLFSHSAEVGAATGVYLACAPEVAGITGCYFAKCRHVVPAAMACNQAAAEHLWQLSCVQTGIASPMI